MGAALFQISRIRNSQLQSFQVSDQKSFQLTGFQLSSALVSGGVQHKASHTQLGQQAWPTRPFSTASTLMSLTLANQTWLTTSKIALRRRRTLSALTLHSLSLALSAWLKTSSKTAWRDIALRQSLFPPSLSTTSSHRSASMRALTTTSFRTTSSFRTTLSCFRTTSSSATALEKELSKTVLELELVRSFLPINLVRLVLMIILNKSFGKFSFRNSACHSEQSGAAKPATSATVPDRELFQLHLSQLCQQDPDSAISRQLPEEPLSASGLQTAAWPAAVQIDNLSFSKQNLSEQDLSNISLDKFFPENFGKQLSEQQLQTNLSIDQRQLQNNQLNKNNLQQLSLEHTQLHKRRSCTTSLQQPLPRTA